ncbi:MAG: hypothetical protein MJE77_12925 [Proteobacteria bacterium]|nr:hypothetical protein [Pseudomonadota bacterium]
MIWNSQKQSHDRAARIIARSMFRELLASGYKTNDVVCLATELISLVAVHMSSGRALDSGD